ncbi:MAG: FAD-binding oxidoreductase [Armatimonadetes bacterium]|nr:FAD-binding oxidoreductase [Armatimonadota bacterium]MDE2207269.1 FAD-binding oxidoreductase [Armatimonadota bacterium]
MMPARPGVACVERNRAVPVDRLERINSWGNNASAMAYVFRPSTVEAAGELFQLATRRRIPVVLRGGGCSYGDASLLAEAICLDTTRMARILAWDPTTGVMDVEPGVTFAAMWAASIGDGWWPPVVPGTMAVTAGGAASMNIHGKNNWRTGVFGEHILEADLLSPDGTIHSLDSAAGSALMRAAIGGAGLLGLFTRLRIQMKRVHSGMLHVTPFATGSFEETIAAFEARLDRADYLVGWVDCFTTGAHAGRTLAHEAAHLPEGLDREPAQTLRIDSQNLPDTLFGVLPKSLMWRLMRPMANRLGVRALNAARFGAAHGKTNSYRQSHAAFAFLLDYVPNWKRIYGARGLVQYQSFIPLAEAAACFRRQIEVCHRLRLEPWLGVIKRHRADSFLLSHGVDGYSLALDIAVPADWNRLARLADALNETVLKANGRFYLAKDSTLTPAAARAWLGDAALGQFLAHKQALDPGAVLQSALAHRIGLLAH